MLASRSSAIIALLVSCALAVTTAESANAHRNPCHSAHTCPSDHHTYVWHGLSCTSYPDERDPNDKRVVVVAGRTYWCHASAAPTADTAPAAVSPSAPLVGGAAVWQESSKQIAVVELSQLRVRVLGSLREYDRDKFGPAWEDIDRNGCDTRNDILRRDLTKIVLEPGSTLRRPAWNAPRPVHGPADRLRAWGRDLDSGADRPRCCARGRLGDRSGEVDGDATTRLRERSDRAAGRRRPRERVQRRRRRVGMAPTKSVIRLRLRQTADRDQDQVPALR